MKTRNLTFHTDPAHGWLEVSLADIHDFGIGDKISRYSYIKGDRVFLEEDCDAGIYLEKAKEEGWDISVTEKHTNHDSFIRNLASFSRNEECLVVYPSYNLVYDDYFAEKCLPKGLPTLAFEPFLQEKHQSYCPSNEGFPCKCWDVDYIADVALNSACAKIQEMLDVATGDLASQYFSGDKMDQAMDILKEYISTEMGAKIGR